MLPSLSPVSASFESASPAKLLLAEMYFSPALVLAALPFLVAAVPVDESPRNGFSIPIAKRSVIRNADGAVDIAMLQARTRRTVASVFRLFFFFFENPHDLSHD